MHKFDYSFLKNGKIDANLLNIVVRIYGLRNLDKERQAKFPKVFTELEKIAKVQSVKYSNAIEGIVTTDERILSIVTESTAPLNHDEAEIAGYRDVLNLIHGDFSDITFDTTTILGLHRQLLALVGGGGYYKTQDNLIMKVDGAGQRRVRFRPVSAKETVTAMEQMVLAYIEANNNPRINKLLLIPCVVLDFLCIHPFSDGNGRMSRLLTLLLLYQSGFDGGKYISLEQQISEHKDLYYEALETSSAGWHENANDYSAFIFNFLAMLYACYKALDRRFAVVNSKRVTKKARVEATVLNSLQPISKKEICTILPDVSPTTVEAVLGKMVQSGSVKKVGSGQSTKYFRK